MYGAEHGSERQTTEVYRMFKQFIHAMVLGPRVLMLRMVL